MDKEKIFLENHMIQKESWLHIGDATTVQWLQVFHLYKGFKRRTSYKTFFSKGSAKIVTPPRIEYKGFKFKYNIKGDICRTILIRLRKGFAESDGSTNYFSYNTGVLIKKKQNLKSKYLQGPVEKSLKRKRFKIAYRTIL